MTGKLTIVNGRVLGHAGITAVAVVDGLIAAIEAAIEAGTGGTAQAAFEDHRRGPSAVGHDADLAVLDRDLLAEGASAIIGTTSVATLVGGRIVYRSEGAA
jgi:predicted amidohydrolase YtcJ